MTKSAKKLKKRKDKLKNEFLKVKKLTRTSWRAIIFCVLFTVGATLVAVLVIMHEQQILRQNYVEKERLLDEKLIEIESFYKNKIVDMENEYINNFARLNNQMETSLKNIKTDAELAAKNEVERLVSKYMEINNQAGLNQEASNKNVIGQVSD